MARFWENGSDHAGTCPQVRRMLKLLSLEVSLEVLLQLATQECDVGSIADALELDGAIISRQLKKLHSYSMVQVRRLKRQHLYSLGPGVEVFTNGHSIHIRARTSDGGEVALTIPRLRM